MTFEEQLKTEGKLVYTCKGVSMRPLLRAGKDLVEIRACDPAGIRRLDAVLFVRNGGKKAYILHRVLRRNRDGTFWIVGDNCISGETVRGEQILGRLESVVRDGKRIRVTDRGYRLYVNLWCRPYRLRFFLLRTRIFFSGIKRFLKRRMGHEKQ